MVCIPLGYQLINNIHFGGFKLFQEFLISAFNPKIDNEIIITVINRLNETILIGFFSWLVSIIFGAIFGIISSNIFYKIFNIPNFFYRIIRFFLTIIRSIHEVVWGILLMQIYGINFSIGIIAICIPYIAVNSKVFAEQLETIDYKSFESINQINAPKFSSLLTLIWNPIINTFKNFGLYRLECSIRSTVILGLFGIGGIGTSIFLSFQTLNFRELWTYLWSLAILIILSGSIFQKIKFNNKVLHQSKLVNYFNGDYAKSQIEKDLEKFLKKIKKDKKYFLSKKDIIFLEALKSDGIQISKKYDSLYQIKQSEMPADIQFMIENDEIGAALLRVIEVIGPEKIENLDEDTVYFIINTLNQLNVDLIRNKLLLKVLPLKV